MNLKVQGTPRLNDRGTGAVRLHGGRLELPKLNCVAESEFSLKVHFLCF